MTSPNSASPPGTEVSIAGTRVPQLGFGTWLLYGEAATEAIADAVKVGYRHIDTARGYENERRVGAALATTQIARSDLFITTKILLSGRDHPIPGAIGYKPGLISWLLDWSHWVVHRDTQPIQYWMQIVMQTIIMLSCLAVAVFGWFVATN